jgi:hypothetical protein
MFDAIKIIAGGTVYQKILSASNADSTLQIVKEQQPIFRLRLANLRRTYVPLRFANLLMSELVEDDGIEPTTPCLQSRCSPS